MSTQEPVISNSSPLIHLAKIDQLGLLPGCFGEVLIPRAVYDECVTEGRDRPEMAMIKQAAWLRVVEVLAVPVALAVRVAHGYIQVGIRRRYPIQPSRHVV